MEIKSALFIFLFNILSMQLTASTPLSPIQHSIENKELKILSWNIYLLPYLSLWNSNRSRAKAIARELNTSDYHVIVFQEAFSSSCRQILSKSLSDEYPYQYGPANPNYTPLRTNSGLWVVSKIPLTKIQEIQFSGSKGYDAVARKGAVLFEGLFMDAPFQLVVTHLQADNSCLLREKQCLEIKEQLLNAHYRKEVPQLICGDFNIDMNDQGNYQQMLQTLDAQNGLLNGTVKVTYDEINNNLARIKNGKSKVIDYVLVRNEQFIENIERKVRTFISSIGSTTTFLSDHYAMEVNVIFKIKAKTEMAHILP